RDRDHLRVVPREGLSFADPLVATSASLADLPANLNDGRPTRWWHWLILLLLALAIHALFLTARVPWNLEHAPRPLDVQTINPQQLDQIRKQWRKNQPLGLIKPNAGTPRAEEAPSDSRYMSDRNIHVQKE